MVWGPVSLALLCALGALLVAAALEDIRHREIANWKNGIISVLAPLWWVANGIGGIEILWQIGVALLVFGFFAGMFALGLMGGGDVKMIGAITLWLPLQPLLGMLIAMALAGGAITLAMTIERRWRLDSTASIEVPYGVAIAIAGLLAIREPLFNQIA